MRQEECAKGEMSVCERYTLTITEAGAYYHIGENKLRMIADEHPEADLFL